MHILRTEQVLERVQLSRSLLYQLMATGDFPRPVKLTARLNGWPEDEVSAWIEARMAARAAE